MLAGAWRVVAERAEDGVQGAWSAKVDVCKKMERDARGGRSESGSQSDHFA